MSKKIERFEDFVAWQKARKLTVEIYLITAQGRFASEFWVAGSKSARFGLDYVKPG